MLKITKWITAFLAIAVCNVSSAQLSDESVDLLMQLSGLNQQVAALPESFKAGMLQASQQDPNIPESWSLAATAAVDKTVVPDEFLGNIRRTVAR